MIGAEGFNQERAVAVMEIYILNRMNSDAAREANAQGEVSGIYPPTAFDSRVQTIQTYGEWAIGLGRAVNPDMSGTRWDTGISYPQRSFVNSVSRIKEVLGGPETREKVKRALIQGAEYSLAHVIALVPTLITYFNLRPHIMENIRTNPENLLPWTVAATAAYALGTTADFVSTVKAVNLSDKAVALGIKEQEGRVELNPFFPGRPTFKDLIWGWKTTPITLFPLAAMLYFESPVVGFCGAIMHLTAAAGNELGNKLLKMQIAKKQNS